MPVNDYRAGADTAGTDLHWVAETNWGQVPAGPPTLNTARITSNTLQLAKTTQRSNEIDSTRQIKQRILTSLMVQGATGWELSLDEPGGGDLIDLFEGALFGTWTADLGITGTINASSVDDSFTDNLAAGTMFANVQIGQWIKVGGFVDPANNGIFQVTGKPNNDKIIVDSTLVTEAGTGNETVAGRNLRDGQVVNSYVLEDRQSDLTPNVYLAYLGMMIGNFEAAFQTDAIVTGNFGWMGKTQNAPSGSSVGSGFNPKSVAEVANTITQTGSIREGGAAPSAVIRTINVRADNALRVQRGIGGGAEASGMGFGDFDLTGRLEAFLLDSALMTKYRNHTPTQLDWRVTAEDGRALVLTVPQARLSSKNIDASGPNQDRLQQYDFEAESHPTWGFTFQLDSFAP